MQNPRIVLDPVQGYIELSPLQEELLDQPELQRMRWVKQLGLSDLIFPGAHHSRIEHCLGASHIATKIAEHLGIEEKEKTLVQAAGILHDIGHTPFSHVLEPLLPQDSMEITREMIEDGSKVPLPNGGQIPAILEKYGLKPKDVVDLICHCYKGKKCLQQILFSEIDCDQMDYLSRDSYYTGTSLGEINLPRLISIMRLVDDTLVFAEKGLTEIEQLIVARNHMYSSVYLHHANSGATKMMVHAFQQILNKHSNFVYMTDAEAIAALLNGTEYTKEIIQRILFRKLFKGAFNINARTTTKKEIEIIDKLSKKGEKAVEDELAKKAKIPEGYLLVYLAKNVISASEPRMKEFNINILRKDSSVVQIRKVSPIVEALTKQLPSADLFVVYTPKEYTTKAAEAAKELFR